jgi:ketosteroid isomerase-like protein
MVRFDAFIEASFAGRLLVFDKAAAYACGEVSARREQKWSDMYGQGDVDGIAALLSKDSFLLAPGHSPAIGRGDVVALTRALMDAEAADGVSVAWQSQNAVISSSGDMAFDYGRATSTLADGSVIEGSYLVVWINEDGEWKAAADIFN